MANINQLKIDNVVYDLEVSGINITSGQATVGQFLVADGNGGCAWQTIPQANTQSF